MKPDTITAILLAAGQSSRFGGNKLQAQLVNGQALGLVCASRLRDAHENLVVVVSNKDDPLVVDYASLGAEIVVNPQAHLGMASSLVCGIQATSHSRAWLVALADMPYVQVTTIHQIIGALKKGDGLVVPRYLGERGHPVGFSRQYKQQLLNLWGDRGGAALLQQYADQVTYIDTDDEGVLLDIDEPADITNAVRNPADLSAAN